MALELPYGYKNLNPDGSSNVDEAYGYYNSLAEAYAAIPLAMRKGGRTVGIKQGDGSIVEYWWENDNDLSDSGLVVKTAESGTFDPDDYDLDEFQNESSNPYARMDDLPAPGLYTIPQSGADIGKLDLSNPLGLDATTNINEVESLSIKSGSVVGGNITFRSRTTLRPTIAGAIEQVYLSEPSANFDNTATYTVVVWKEANKINWLMRKRS